MLPNVLRCSWLEGAVYLLPKSFPTFAFTATSILMNGGQGSLKPSPGSFFDDSEFGADGDFARGVVEHGSRQFHF
jgi:hypothetical protein